MSEQNILLPIESSGASSPSNAIEPLRLTVIDGAAVGQTFTRVHSGTFLIGRSTRVQCCLPSGVEGDPRVSHTHCLIEFEPPLCRIHDLNSINGTFVNGKQIDASVLLDGDTIRIGRTVLTIQFGSRVEAEAKDFLDESLEGQVPPLQILPKTAPEGGSICPVCLRSSKDLAAPLCVHCEAKVGGLDQPVSGYRLVRAIGSGDLGVVYLALCERSGRAVAIKLIDLPAVPKPGNLACFLRKAELLKRLRHRHVVSCYDVGSVGKTIYLVMELIRGTNVKRLLKRGMLSVQAAVRIVCQLLSALKYAHARQIVHRDVKTANLLIKIRPDRQIMKVADFGAARNLHDSHVGGVVLPGDITGLTAFMAPERVLDTHCATPAIDQYSAAATLYNLLTNRFVYDQPPRIADQFAQILDEEVVPIRERRSGLPSQLISIVHRALSRDPNRRFPDVAAFKKALMPFG